MQPTPAPTVVLVHGALTDASVWHGVVADLQARGHHVVAPPLPMRSLAGDVACLRGVLDALDDGPVVLAGHSWGGAVISDPAALTAAVHALVFVAAFAPDAGETAGELNHRFPGSGLVPETTVVHAGPGGGLLLQQEHFAPVYAADVGPTVAAVMAAAQRPIDPAALGESFDGRPTWRAMPSWTVVATADRSIPPAAQRFMAERARSTVTEIDSSHAVPVAHPHETADVIAAAVLATAAPAR